MSITNPQTLRQLGCELWWPGEKATANSPKSVTAAGNATQILPFPGAGIGMFDGNGDYVSAAYDSNLVLSNNDFTLECMFYMNTQTANVMNCILGYSNTSLHTNIRNGILQYYGSTNNSSWDLFSGYSDSTGVGSITVTANVWHHFAICRVGNVITGYIDGVVDFTKTISGSFYTSTSTVARIGVNGNNSIFWKGYITEVRYTIGISRYFATFTPPQYQLTNDSNTKLLLHFLNPLTDSSSNNLKITPSGSFTLSNAYPSPVTTNSVATVFDGASHISTPVNTGDILGISGDNWTFEMYALFTRSIIDNNLLFMGNESNDSNRFQFLQYYGPAFGLGSGYGYTITDSTSGIIRWQAIATPQLNTWYHIALVKTGLNVELYIDGQIQTKTTGTTLSANIPARVTYPLIIGKYRQSYYHLNGMLSEVRWSNTARYSESFTPSTTRYVADANTKLLMHLDRIPSAIDDYSPTPKQITAYGNATQLTSPCGSGVAYFDGTGDFLTIADSSVLELGTGNWTIQGRFYLSTISRRNGIICKNDTTARYPALMLEINASNRLVLTMSSNGSSNDIANAIAGTTTTFAANTWYDIKIIRNGTSIVVYVNDSAEITITSSATPVDSSYAWGIGCVATDGTGSLLGYISEFEYASTARPLTIATQPFKPDLNTKLLLHMDGVGNAFYDASDAPGDNGFPILPAGVTITPNGTFTSVKLKNGLNCYKFDGSTNYVSIQDHEAWNLFESNFTITFWFNYASVASVRTLLQQLTTTSNFWMVTWGGNVLYLLGLVSSSYTFQYTCPFTPVVGTWYYITIERSGTSCLIYINNVLQTVSVVNAWTGTTNIAAPLTIGNDASDSARLFYGNIKDLMIFKGQALSVDQIGALMDETFIY